MTTCQRISTRTVPNRLPALRRFAVAITILNVLGHFVLGLRAVVGPAAGRAGHRLQRSS